jgi:hypothetical protein
VLHVPDSKELSYVQQLLDAYTNTFKSVGDGTTGTQEGNVIIAGPGWNDSLATELQVIKSPTIQFGSLAESWSVTSQNFLTR